VGVTGAKGILTLAFEALDLLVTAVLPSNSSSNSL